MFAKHRRSPEVWDNREKLELQMNILGENCGCPRGEKSTGLLMKSSTNTIICIIYGSHNIYLIWKILPSFRNTAAILHRGLSPCIVEFSLPLFPCLSHWELLPKLVYCHNVPIIVQLNCCMIYGLCVCTTFLLYWAKCVYWQELKRSVCMLYLLLLTLWLVSSKHWGFLQQACVFLCVFTSYSQLWCSRQSKVRA